ncbi:MULTISPECIES: hypothetical protein [unclassified Chryseobacterium]|uniref:hypothetical protein n=1 Tax=unclassified Chryseobacterium TaxID=2593645 RepID=UPI0022698564|nr:MULTISPECIES: hypothetical protein [unclassified Chryseobacterium]
MRKNLLLAAFLGFQSISAQIGVNTNNPQTAFHVDGSKDNNASGSPSNSQQLNDFTIASSGNLGIGTTIPTTKAEINSGLANISGLKFRNLTSATPTSASGQNLGVDASGNVITVPTPTTPSVVTEEVSNSTGFSYNVNDLDYTLIPSSQQTLNIPVGGKAVFINFMLGIDYFTFLPGGGASYYQARLFIDNAPTNVFLTTQERVQGGSQTQYTMSTVKSLTAGSHTIDVRMIRSFNNGVASGGNMVCRAISMSFNASYINN